MTQPSRLQQAIDAAWPSIEKALAAAKKDDSSATALKKFRSAFLQRDLPATATNLPVRGSWKPGQSPATREYTAVAPVGLVEFVHSGTFSADDLERLTGADADRDMDRVRALVTRAADAELGYALGRLLRADDVKEGSEAPALAVIEAARRCLSLPLEPLAFLIAPGTETALDADVAKKVRLALAGGPLIEVPLAALGEKAVILPSRPKNVIWHTAIDMQAGWAPQGDDACISVINRLVLELGAPVSFYRAKVDLTPPT